MKEQIIRDIRAYIKFLEQQGFTISLSLRKTPFAAFAVELMQYDFHPHAVCNYLKQNPGTEGRCVHNKVILKKMNLKKPRYACCYAGVEEFLFPLYHESSFVCYVHVSGYRGVLEQSIVKMKRVCAQATGQFLELYGELSTQAPAIEQVRAFVAPLQYMLLQLYGLYLERRAEGDITTVSKSLYIKALQFINENYPKDISCDTLARELGYSASYVRYVLKKEGGISLQAKINQVRLASAKRLLRSTNMSITDIAFSVGFSDSNYFSAFFKKHENQTPNAYRKTFR